MFGKAWTMLPTLPTRGLLLFRSKYAPVAWRFHRAFSCTLLVQAFRSKTIRFSLHRFSKSPERCSSYCLKRLSKCFPPFGSSPGTLSLSYLHHTSYVNMYISFQAVPIFRLEI